MVRMYDTEQVDVSDYPSDIVFSAGKPAMEVVEEETPQHADGSRVAKPASVSGRWDATLLNVTLFLFFFASGFVLWETVTSVTWRFTFTEVFGTIGSITAVFGTLASFFLIGLAARLPWVERQVGQPNLLALHKKVGPYAVTLVVVHVVATTLSWGYSDNHSVLFIPEFWDIVTGYSWMMPALLGFVLMLGASLLSYASVKKLMHYDTWWVTHLYLYLAIVLSFGHQLVWGTTFANNPGAFWVWVAVFVGVFGAVAVFRVAAPMWNSRKNRLVVSGVVNENSVDGTYSVYIKGRKGWVDNVQGGQYFVWRFLTRGKWWRGHPYSVSRIAHVDSKVDAVRITVKPSGSESTWLKKVKPGTRVYAEGPYGVFTAQSVTQPNLCVLAAGVGITPVFSLLGELPQETSVTVLWKIRSDSHMPLKEELQQVIQNSNGKFYRLQDEGNYSPPVTEEMITGISDSTNTDYFVCGNPFFVENCETVLKALNVPKSRIHHESF